MNTYLVTGGAGFIGSHLCEALLARGDRVACVDNFNDYYDPQRKRRNVAAAQRDPNYACHEADLRDNEALSRVFATVQPTHIAHLAAMAGPRRSIQQPRLYAAVNIDGTINVLEQARLHGVQAIVLASTSSVYGIPERVPFREDDPTDRPLSPYGATKKAAEVLAYTFHYLYGVPTTVVRPFTVFGPRGRPDMTPHLFVNAMVKGEAITLFNGGREVYRDYTYVGDFVPGVIAALDKAHPFEIFNLGNSRPIEMRHFMEVLQQVTGLDAVLEEKPAPRGEPLRTHADISKARELLGYNPSTDLETGLRNFWNWYQAEILGETAARDGGKTWVNSSAVSHGSLKESHDSSEESCDSSPASVDSLAEPTGGTKKPHDAAEESCDSVTEPIDAASENARVI